MTDILNEYMRTNRESGSGPGLRLVKCIECNDGFTISVQGHRGAYSQPRENGADHYSKVECGYPSGPVPSLSEYKDDAAGKDEESVYGYVPVDVVIALLNEHGGIKGPAAC
jgi:hypothetical protein